MPEAVNGATSTAAAVSRATTSVDRPDQMGKDTFLRLLVAQLRYQDPTNPASTTDFMAQTATFTQVEKLEEIAGQNAALLALQRSASAGALVGRSITWTDATGASSTGVVTSVRLGTGGSGAVAMVGSTPVEAARITEIASTSP